VGPKIARWLAWIVAVGLNLAAWIFILGDRNKLGYLFFAASLTVLLLHESIWPEWRPSFGRLLRAIRTR
jgi:hypothetical protein